MQDFKVSQITTNFVALSRRGTLYFYTSVLSSLVISKSTGGLISSWLHCFRYIQVGNAVAVPVARALGYALGLALKGSAGVDPVFPLPEKFPNIQCQIHSASSEDDA